MALRLLAAVLIGGAALFAAPALASAAPISFDFSNCGQITGPLPFVCPNADSTKTSLTYTNSGLSITTYGYVINTLTGANLYVKQGGTPAETGLGIAADVNHEINSNYVVDLDTLMLYNHGITSGNLSLASVQTNENYKVCVESTKGQVNTNANCWTGSGGNIVTLNNIGWDATNRYIAITSPGPGNVLVASELIIATPEPGTMALFATGLTGFALFRRRFGVGPRL
jgi:hypothetical protein